MTTWKTTHCSRRRANSDRATTLASGNITTCVRAFFQCAESIHTGATTGEVHLFQGDKRVGQYPMRDHKAEHKAKNARIAKRSAKTSATGLSGANFTDSTNGRVFDAVKDINDKHGLKAMAGSKKTQTKPTKAPTTGANGKAAINGVLSGPVRQANGRFKAAAKKSTGGFTKRTGPSKVSAARFTR
jgi:hypothetical protein